MTRRIAAISVVRTALAMCPSVASADMKGPAIIKKLNAIRAKAGIPKVKHSALDGELQGA